MCRKNCSSVTSHVELGTHIKVNLCWFLAGDVHFLCEVVKCESSLQLPLHSIKMVSMKGHRILSPFQALFLLSICIVIGNTVALSLDSLHSSRESEDNSFKTALDNIHYRRRMAEKRRQPIHYESRFSKKDSHRWRDLEDEADRKYYQRYAGNKYASSLSRNVERFLSEIGDEDNKDARKKKKEDDNNHEEELKPDGSFIEESAEKRTSKRPYDTDIDGPSRIFAHKSSPVSDSIQERAESLTSDNESEENDHDSSLRRKKERSNIMNYSPDNEHYSRFWDPERRARNIFHKKETRNRRGEPTILRNAKRRYSKRRSYHNHPSISSHTNIKRSKDTKEQILGELKEILKDEDGEKRDVKKRENDKDEKLTETKLDNSSDVQGNEISAENTFDESPKSEKEDGDKFNEWLRDEYFKTMAMTMATMKKKRGTWDPAVSADVDEKILPRQQLEILEEMEDEKPQKFQAIEEKLESIESAMLTDALQLIRKGAEGREPSEAYGEQVLNKLYAANDIQQMREALDNLRRTMVHMRRYQDESINDDDNINTWSNFAPIKREEENLAKALGVMAPNQSKRRYQVPNGEEPYIPRVSMRSLPSFAPDDSSSQQLVSVYDSPPGETLDDDITDGSDCPALDLLSSDCSVLGDIVPGGTLRRLVLEACNWHEVCYSCGGGFGLSSDECDVGFVEQSRTICQDDIPCQTTARMMLMPLRQRRVFFKRSVPAICYRDPCVERFLQHG